MANAQINVGDFGGVVVHEQPERYVIEVSKFENKVAQQFKGKVRGGFYSEYVNDSGITQKENHSLLGVSKNLLRTDEQIRDFNRRVSEGAKISAEIKADFTNIHDILNFETVGKKLVTRYGQDTTPAKDEASYATKKDWAYGEVLARNNSYVAFSAGETDDAKFVRILSTEKFLLNKEEQENSASVLDQRLKVGSYKKLLWTKEENQQAKIIVSDEVPKKAVKKEQANAVVKDVAKEKLDHANLINAVEEGKAVQAKRSKKKEQTLAA